MTVRYNPFYYGGTLKESRLFVGRKSEVREVCEAIAQSASVSVVGERRVGKSSLLQYLADPSVEQKNGLHTAHYVFAYFDFLGYPTITPTELWQRLLGEMRGQVAEPGLETALGVLAGQEKIELADLERLLKQFRGAGRKLVILFDEFDTATANPHFDQAFFGGLRNLSKYQLSYIVASHRTLSDLHFAHADALVSPFFNIFRRITLGGFTAAEVEELLAGALAETGITFSPGDREMLDSLADSHPFFVQTAAYFLFDAYRYGYLQDGIPDYRWVQERVRDNAVEHFRYYWDESAPGEQLILATLALLEPDELVKYQLYPAENNPQLRLLRARVLVTEGPDGWPRIFSTLFGEWIAETVAFVPVAKVPDLRAAVEATKVRGFQRSWIETTERIRRGFAWVDVRAIVKWLLVEKGAESLLDWIHQLLQLGAH